MGWQLIKKHLRAPEIKPLAVAVCFGGVLAVFTAVRLTTHHSVMWNKKSNPEPWNEAKNKCFPDNRPSMQTDRYKDI